MCQWWPAGLVVSVLAFSSSSLGSNPGWEQCLVFSCKILYS